MTATAPMTPEQEVCKHEWEDLGITADFRHFRIRCTRCDLIHDVERRILHESSPYRPHPFRVIP